MFAQLGTIIFENLTGFTDFNKTEAAVYAEHSLLDGKPRLQATGFALDEITLYIRFHVAFCNPSEQFDLLKTSKDTNEILPLVWGNGKVEGSFVITEISKTIEDADKSGNVFSLSVNLTLREYVTADKLTQEKQTNRQIAKAVGNKKTTAQLKTNPSTCPQTISHLVNGIENNAAQINSVFTQKGGITTKNKNDVKLHLSASNILCDQILKRTADPASCTQSYPDIQSATNEVKVRISSFTLLIKNNYDMTPTEAAIIGTQNTAFQTDVKALKAASVALINAAITRKA